MTTQNNKEVSRVTIVENKQLVRRFIEVQNQMNLEALDQLVAPEMIDHSGRGSGREGAKQLLALFASAFPDWFATIEDLIAEGDKVVMRGVASGTHRGVFMGIPPTGRRVTVPGIHIMRISDGKIVEHWGEGDFLGMMQQLGVIPGSTEAPPSVGGCTGHQKGAHVGPIQENKALCARPHEEIFNQGNLALADEIFSPEFAWYEAHLPPLPKGPASIKVFATMLRAAFPELHLTVEDSIAEGDRVVNRWSFRGTHCGEFYGVPPTGREVTTSGIDVWRVEDGKIVENQQVVDNLGLLQQLGAIPQPELARTWKLGGAEMDVNQPDNNRNGRTPVIFLPGIIMPPALRYAPLIRELGNSVQAVTKELEVYAGPTPPADHSIDAEVEGVSRAADAAGFERFHLYGHSGGGACALAYVATHPERVLSLAVDEPATDFSSEQRAQMQDKLQEIGHLPPSERTRDFLQWQLAPGVEPPPPPPGPPPDWMASRPAGINAFMGALLRYRLDAVRLRSFDRPVYYSYGSLSNPEWQAMRHRLSAIFPDFTAELYEGASHLNTSHQREPARVAAALRRLWERAAADLAERTTPQRG